ncbi:DUF3885 domain-containing protein [Glycomyces dulcitolivorans]|uniref:DUF3885 domain-containing protein n=1 Tax=Glycomyces dulcitolivorans TaxID=2200759 RepID=UPI001E4B2C46|nr:hypothetical protein [Glycomyces dulcitolivorans]
MHERLTELWNQRWPKAHPCLPDQLKTEYRNQWVRFHSLPESKRYPEADHEYATALGRCNTVMDELFNGPIYLMTTVYTSSPDWSGEDEPWRTAIVEDEPGFESYAHLHLAQHEWEPGALDGLLRRVADDAEAGVTITDPNLRWLFHPYDGGMDVLAPTTAERDALRDRHRDWLPKHPLGF